MHYLSGILSLDKRGKVWEEGAGKSKPSGNEAAKGVEARLCRAGEDRLRCLSFIIASGGAVLMVAFLSLYFPGMS